MFRNRRGVNMLSFKRKRSKKTVPSAESLSRKAGRQILMVVIAGMLLMAADFIKSAEPDIKIVHEAGRAYMVRPDEGHDTGHIRLNASVEGDKDTVEKDFDISLDPYSSGEKEKSGSRESSMEMTEKEEIEYELRKTVSSFNDDQSLRRIPLPAALDSGRKISWKVERENNSIIILFVMITASFAIFRSYLSPLEKQRKKEKESVVRNLPEFVNKLVLLLNAGLVLNSAFERTITESLRFREDDDDYFINRIKEIYVSVKTTNSSINEEFRKFAKENGTMDLMRVSNIVNDNINKGVELTEKLQRESETLWINRKKNCEEKGKLAETKLTLPLMIFLIVLIVITVAPALLGI